MSNRKKLKRGRTLLAYQLTPHITMTLGYHFSTNGQITKVKLPPKVRNCNDLPASILGPEYEDQDSMYMVSLPDDYFLMMHEDNDFEKKYKKSKLPINKALRKYFPNSPYKGNVVLVRVDEDDLLKGGKWTDAVLRKFQMGYIEDRAVNEPTIISKDDEDFVLSKVPIPEKTLKAPKPTSLKICDQCGFPKTKFHYEEWCLLNQTKAIVDKVAAIRREHKDLDEYLIEESQPLIEEEGSWKKVTSCKALLGKGLNQSGIRWCNFYLDLFAKKENPIEQRTILGGLTSLLYCYDFNSRLNFSLSECPQCEKDHDECLKQRISDTKLICRALKTMNFSQASDLRKVDLYHLSINVFNQFLTQLSSLDKRVPDELGATMLVSMTFSWAIVLLEEHNFMNLMSEVDRELL